VGSSHWLLAEQIKLHSAAMVDMEQPMDDHHSVGSGSLADSAGPAEDDEDMQDFLKPFVEAEREFVRLQEDGDHHEAVRTLEMALRQNRDRVQQMKGEMLSNLFERLVVGYNTLGMKYLKEGNTEESCKFFEKAEALTDPANLHMTPESRLVLRAVTYNNMGCFYKSMSKLHTALQYLRKAQAIEERSQRCQNPAGTHLNLCALLSQMGKHGEALQHSKRALTLLKASPPEVQSGAGNSESLICVAYFNMGAELEHLRKPAEALSAYQNAYSSCMSELGEDHALSKQISSCLQQLKAKVTKSKTSTARK